MVVQEFCVLVHDICQILYVLVKCRKVQVAGDQLRAAAETLRADEGVRKDHNRFLVEWMLLAVLDLMVGNGFLLN